MSGKRRPVLKVNSELRVLDRYRSVTEAAQKNYMSGTAVYYICKGTRKYPFREGVSYIYEDELKQKLEERYQDYKETAMGMGPKERKHAMDNARAQVPERNPVNGEPICPQCGGVNVHWGMKGYNYCPDCGKQLDFRGWKWL